jgi:hypothetical protein
MKSEEVSTSVTELLALGASDDLVQAVLTTRLATDLCNGAFRRTVWLFLIANVRAIDLAEVGPMIDFVQAIRHERVAVETAEGIVLRDPPQPSFSMKGRTVQSMLRLMHDWHRQLGLANGGLTWAPSPLQPMPAMLTGVGKGDLEFGLSGSGEVRRCATCSRLRLI